MMVDVSVIVPCYCCASTIGRSVKSVVEQSVLPKELILIDDSSPDGGETVRELNEIKHLYCDLIEIKVVLLQRNLGASSARNAGWDVATQPYIAFLDADDSWHPDKLSIQYDYMQHHPKVALCGHQCIWVREEEKVPELPSALRVSRIRPGSLLLKNPFSTPSVMVRADIPFRFQEGKRCAEDFLLWQEVAYGGLEVERIESPLAYVHKPLYGEGGLSAQLWEMEKGELSNFVTLYKTKNIGLLSFVIAYIFSLIKYARRVILIQLKNLAK